MKNLILLFCLMVGITSAQEATEKPTIVILIRHAEKGDDGTKDPALAEAGIARANHLVSILKNTNVSAIYSSNYKRTKATVEPIAKSQHLEVRTYEPNKEEEIKRILADNKGKTILIAGHSNTTPWAANFLTGSKLVSFADSDYGNMLIVTFWDFGKTSMTWLNY